MHRTSLLFTLAAATALMLSSAPAQSASPAQPGAVLVELFTSEGCSSCPPADQLLRRIDGQASSAGQLVIGLSEHVTYWNGLGWTDPYSSEQSTDRQRRYGGRFALDSVYTPQMVVNGREQFVGSNQRSLQDALNAEAREKHIALHLLGARVEGKTITVHYAAADLPAHNQLELFMAIADDQDRQSVPRGENSGRELVHTSVVRALIPLGKLQAAADASITAPLPTALEGSKPRHVVLFAQQGGLGAVLGIDTKPLI